MYDFSLDELVMCRADDGRGGWSLHPPRSTDTDIAAGESPVLLVGPGEADAEGNWTRPNQADRLIAAGVLQGLWSEHVGD